MSAQIFIEPEPGTDGTIKVPKVPLYMATALAALVFAIAISARVFGVGRANEPASTPVEQRSIRFIDTQDGATLVQDAATGLEVVRLAPGNNGFIFGVLRSVKYKRTVAHVDPSTPFTLTRWQDGRITLDDSSSNVHVSVNSFGPTQIASFEQLFAKPANR